MSIPKGNINTIKYENGVGIVTLQPGDATNYQFDFIPIGDFVIIATRSPCDGYRIDVPLFKLQEIPSDASAYDNETVCEVGSKIGSIHTAAIILLAVRYLLDAPDDILGAANCAMRIRTHRPLPKICSSGNKEYWTRWAVFNKRYWNSEAAIDYLGWGYNPGRPGELWTTLPIINENSYRVLVSQRGGLDI